MSCADISLRWILTSERILVSYWSVLHLFANLASLTAVRFHNHNIEPSIDVCQQVAQKSVIFTFTLITFELKYLLYYDVVLTNLLHLAFLHIYLLGLRLFIFSPWNSSFQLAGRACVIRMMRFNLLIRKFFSSNYNVRL